MSKVTRAPTKVAPNGLEVVAAVEVMVQVRFELVNVGNFTLGASRRLSELQEKCS